jgi:AhpC/TSA family
VLPVAISVDAPEVSRDLSKKAGYTFPIFSDPQLDAVRRYHLVHAGAGPEGHDIASAAGRVSGGLFRYGALGELHRRRSRKSAS